MSDIDKWVILGYVVLMVICVFMIIFCRFMRKRNRMVAKIRAEVVDYCYKKGCESLRKGIYFSDEEVYKVYEDGPTYRQMLWDFRKNKLKDFYPDLEI